jgi:nitrilase
VTIALFPGSFDPFHLGHLSIVEWAAQLHDEVVVGILGNPEKPSGMFTPDARAALATTATAHLPNVRCVVFRGVTGDLAKREHADVIIRSAHKDADLERSLAVLNKFMSEGVPTEFAPSDPGLEHISSTKVRDLLASGDGEAASALVPEAMRAELATAPKVESQPAASGRSGSGPMTAGRRVEALQVAVTVSPPVYLDRDSTLDLALSLVARAAGEGAQLVMFPQGFLPGYPAWVHGAERGGQETPDRSGDLFDNAVVVGSAVTQVLALAAKRHRVYVSIGVTERVDGGAALFCSQLLFSPAGATESVQRLLSPVGDEALTWGRGLAAPAVVDTPFGRIGTLPGNDVRLPLARAALQAQGLDLLLAPTSETGDSWVATLRAAAREAGIFVVGANHAAEIQNGVPGGSGIVIGPSGVVLAGPGLERAFVRAGVDVNEARHLRHSLDPGGQAGRGDLFELRVKAAD